MVRSLLSRQDREQDGPSEEMMAKKKREKPSFDSGSRPRSQQNRTASRARGLRWNARKGFYVGPSGELVLDRFGQPL